jgi:hypothetical protein
MKALAKVMQANGAKILGMPRVAGADYYILYTSAAIGQLALTSCQAMARWKIAGTDFTYLCILQAAAGLLALPVTSCLTAALRELAAGADSPPIHTHLPPPALPPLLPLCATSYTLSYSLPTWGAPLKWLNVTWQVEVHCISTFQLRYCNFGSKST